jgi:hypothetical protein
MGWLHDDFPDHEGYLVGVVASGHGYRELGAPSDREARLGVDALQVGCECGWRSRRYHAPLGTRWFPFMVELPKNREKLEDAARAVWIEHLHGERKREQVLTGAGDQPNLLRPHSR